MNSIVAYQILYKMGWNSLCLRGQYNVQSNHANSWKLDKWRDAVKMIEKKQKKSHGDETIAHLHFLHSWKISLCYIKIACVTKKKQFSRKRHITAVVCIFSIMTIDMYRATMASNYVFGEWMPRFPIPRKVLTKIIRN